MLSYMIACHLFGDFLLQNNWMQRKSKSSFVCAVHVTTYMIPFVALAFLMPLPLWLLISVAVEHFLQDRFALHLKWMKHWKHTTSEQWPIGPLCVDQSMHIVFMAIITLFAL